MNSFRCCIFFCLASFISLNATLVEPWLGNQLEIEWRNQLVGQSYRSIAYDSFLRKKPSQDLFYNSSLNSTILDFGVELEAIFAWTGKQQGNLDAFRFTGRYAILDDVAGDPISLTFGAILSKASWKALKDKSSFHHGLGECECFVSFGKEQPFQDEWVQRWWGFLGLGIAERGSPWIRAKANYERRFLGIHQINTFLEGLVGLGVHRLSHPFSGYGPIQHGSLDIGVGYRYLLWEGKSVGMQYSFRLYARNFPAYTHRFFLEYVYPFGI